jgi:hypothetical protein
MSSGGELRVRKGDYWLVMSGWRVKSMETAARRYRLNSR